jgi:hypothetical protein
MGGGGVVSGYAYHTRVGIDSVLLIVCVKSSSMWKAEFYFYFTAHLLG